MGKLAEDNCGFKDTCRGSELCWSSCPLKSVYKNTVKKTPEAYQKPYLDFFKYIAEGRNIFLTAPAGYGKTYLINQLDSVLPNKITMTATTGVAALNINGATLHSTLGLGIGKQSVKVLVQKMNKYKIDFLNRLDILVVDEVSMLSSELLDKCNELLKLVRLDNKPFGGVQTILIGDFCQLPPVDEKPNKDYCFYSQTWKELNLANVILDYNYRQETDKPYSNMLSLLRQGKLTQEGFDLIKSRTVENPPEDIPNLYATNAEVYQYNIAKLKELNQPIETFQATYGTPNKNIANNPEFYNSLVEKIKKYSKAEDKLEICVGSRVMLTRNTDLNRGLVNGSLGYVKSINDEHIEVRFDNDETYYVKKVDVEMHDAEGKVLVWQHQYPLKLANAITIHSSQGSTLEKVFIDFNRFFEVNQAYVALSRVKSSAGLFVKNFKTSAITFAPEVLEFYKNLNKC